MSTSIDTMSANRTSARTIFYVSSLLILPVLYVFFYVLKVRPTATPLNTGCQMGQVAAYCRDNFVGTDLYV
jgi:hypothetical protein